MDRNIQYRTITLMSYLYLEHLTVMGPLIVVHLKNAHHLTDVRCLWSLLEPDHHRLSDMHKPYQKFLYLYLSIDKVI